MAVEQFTIGRFSASVLSWMALMVLGASFIVYIVSFSTMGWARTGFMTILDVTSGLWRRCVLEEVTQRCFSIQGQEVSSVFAAAQAFAIITLLLLAGSLVLLCGYIFVEKFNKDQRIAWGVLASAIGASLCAIITCATFVHGEKAYINDMELPSDMKIQHHLGYSFALCIFSLLLDGAAGGLLLVEQRYGKDLIPA